MKVPSFIHNNDTHMQGEPHKREEEALPREETTEEVPPPEKSQSAADDAIPANDGIPEADDTAATEEPAAAEELTAPPHSISFTAVAVAVVLFVVAAVGGMYLWGTISEEGRMAPPSRAPLVVGGITPLTGDAASFGIPIQQAALLAAKEINAQGGIGGRKLVLYWEDGKCEGENARRAAEKLFEEHPDMVALIAGSCSSEFLAAAPLAQARGVLSFSSSATSPNISTLGRLVFRTAPSDALAGKVAAEYAFFTMGARRAAIITEDKDYPQGLREVFRRRWGELGGTVVTDAVFAPGTTDFADIARRVKESGADVVYLLPQSPTPGVLAVKALKEEKVPAQLLTAEVLLIRDAIAEQGKILDGVVGIEVFFDKDNPRAQQLIANYEAEYGLEPTYPGFMAGMYDLMYLLKESYEATDGTPEAMAEYLYRLRGWRGAVGKLSFDRNGDPSLVYSIRKIENGAAVTIDLVEPR